MTQTSITLTFQTRFITEKEIDNILDLFASLFNKVERSLYSKLSSGNTLASCKNAFLKKYGITARQFNACKINLEGKIAAYKASQERNVINLKEQIQALNKKIQYLENKSSKKFILHQKKRRQNLLTERLKILENNIKKNQTPLCFGGKKLFNAQFYLKQNGYSSHIEWKKDWKAKRNSEFFVIGSKDETAGNQTCTAKIQENGQICLRLRLPHTLSEQFGKYLELKNIDLKYGYEQFLSALNNPEGQAISYRFKKDQKSWRVFITTDLKKANQISKEEIGVIGIDLNSDHIACIETDRFGNPIYQKIIPWVSYGKSKEQLKALTGDVCKEIIKKAIETKKPIIIEKLDFKNKKSTLKEKNNKFSRLLSSFAYGSFFNFLNARAFKNGIAVHSVNPAFTSVIGCINYAIRYGLSNHLAAALCIARRYQKFSEKPCSSIGKISDGKGSHVAFDLPVRNRTKHVWHFWGQVKKKLRTVLAAHIRAKYRSLNPLKVDSCDSNSRILLV